MRFFVLTCLFVIFGCQSPSENKSSQKQTAILPFEQVLTLLQSSDLAVPPRPDIHPVTAVFNREAIIPPQCYTRTEGTHNPCYVCHQDPISKQHENQMKDGELQADYSFSDLGMTNHWHNLFEDRMKRVNQISDAAIKQWINEDNYSELAGRLKKENFKGWIPDLKNLQEGADAFDQYGLAKDGSYWMAFNYKPFPSTFWPTNGSTDDVMIRLPKPYRTNDKGVYSRDIYLANLSILEATIKDLKQISSPPINEQNIGEDLNQDGRLSIIEHIKKVDSYVGAAKPYFIDTHLYPQHTEFLHTVRYIGIKDNGDITNARRMKEVRYMKKYVTYPKPALAQYYLEESYEKELGQLPGYNNLQQLGLDNGMGWAIQGFIENKHGRLRENSFEETLFCMGCHGSIGSTIDKTFSFARKVEGAQGWKYIDLKGMPDAPNMGESLGEIATYLQRVGGGSEFRHNDEMKRRWFEKNGQLKLDKVKQSDVYTLITPSVERALDLNKAYKIIVEDQDFIFGRDATARPPKNVYDKVDNEISPTLPKDKQYTWDIRLDWPKDK